MRLLSKTCIMAAVAALSLAACDDTTEGIGVSLNDQSDAISIAQATYNVVSRSVPADSVLARTSTGYIGKVKDPETGDYITGDFMAQFNSIEEFEFPDIDSVVVRTAADGQTKVLADSCIIRLYYDNHYGDADLPSKLTAYEMVRPMNEDRSYYSNFSPLERGYVREGGIAKDVTYSLTDHQVPANVRDSAGYTPYITIKLDQPYTAADGKTYANYADYIMHQYYDHPAWFKNAYEFRTHVVPGFFFKHKDGLGSMAEIFASELAVCFKLVVGDSVLNVSQSFWGTGEVLQTTTISNDRSKIDQLVGQTDCTYLKTPAGIFTEMTLPVDEIFRGHEQDTISTARLVIPRINNSTIGEYSLAVPRTVLMIPADSLNTFFAHRNIYNNVNSYVASWAHSSTSTDNNYTFSNISGLLTAMKRSPATSPNRYRVVIVPVEVATSRSSSENRTIVTKVSNDMSLSSTRLVRGTAENGKLKIQVVYSHFK